MTKQALFVKSYYFDILSERFINSINNQYQSLNKNMLFYDSDKFHQLHQGNTDELANVSIKRSSIVGVFLLVEKVINYLRLIIYILINLLSMFYLN